MSVVLTNDSNYTAIASSIRSKLGVSTTYLPSEMSGAIDSIPTGSGYSITVTTSHCTASTSNPTSIGEGNIAELIITPDAGYELAPPTITGASIRKRSVDRIEIENPTGNVTINIEAVQPDYFWVENVGTSTAYLKDATGFMYSTDKLNWTTSKPSFPAGAKIYIKGNIGKTTGSYQTPIPTYGSDIAIGGNVFTLLDYSGILSNYNSACENMFYSCSNIVDASQLYINKVGVNMCYNMFYHCAKLVSPPQLTATTLAKSCYYYMFSGCTSLATAPQLPATTLAVDCYRDMFDGCTSLTTAPSLPATTLANYCYYVMFAGCTSLTTAPSLLATTLANYCCDSMFSGCTSLATAPSLPATTLAVDCYHSMFKNCTSLATAPQLPATTLANDCYKEMFYGCTLLTTVQLPATTLANGCYYRMFYGCTGLTTAPALPATTLADSCYKEMFNGCTSLTTAPALPATNLVQDCYYQMFQDCTALTTAPALPATNLAKDCYSYMFSGCTSLTTAPALPSTQELWAVVPAYDYMFQNCTSLKVYSTSGEGHDVEWRIPSEGVFPGQYSSSESTMFRGTTGDYSSSNVSFVAGKALVVYTQNQPV